MSNFEGLDEDEVFVIRELASMGRSFASISNKRHLKEEVVQQVVEVFLTKGKKCCKETPPDFRQASFWFFQHNKHVLKNHTFAKFEFAIKKCQRAFPDFDKFLEGEYIKKKITDATQWENVTTLWLKNFSEYQDNSSEYLEAKMFKDSGALMSIEREELHMDAVCMIQFCDNSDLGCGSYVNIGDRKGILTHNKVLKTKDQCKNSIAIFEKIDGTQSKVKLKPENFFTTNSKLGITFVEFDSALLKKELDIEPLTDIGEATENCTVYGYYHVRGEKVQLQQKVLSIKESEISYDGKNVNASCRGAPLYKQHQLIAINHGEKKNDYNLATSISAIAAAIKNPPTSVSETGFSVGETVMAKWTDNFYYKAKILHSNETGFRVAYIQFNNDEYDQTVSSLKKISSTTKKKRHDSNCRKGNGNEDNSVSS